MASSLVQALEQRGLGSRLLVEAPRRVLMVVHHSLHSSLTPPQGASPLSHHCPAPPEDLLGGQTRGLRGVPAAVHWGYQPCGSGSCSWVFLGWSRACLTQRAHVWQNPSLDRSTAQALMAVATAGCGVAMVFSIFTIAFCIFLR